MEVDESWIPSLLSIISDSIKYNDSLRHSKTVKDIENIEEWLLQIYQFKDYIEENLKKDLDAYQKYKQHFEK